MRNAMQLGQIELVTENPENIKKLLEANWNMNIPVSYVTLCVIQSTSRQLLMQPESVLNLKYSYYIIHYIITTTLFI